LVVLREPYLGRILGGTKTIESRFSKHRIPPFQCVASGDVLVLKKSGGPILAVAEVARAEFHGPVSQEDIVSILTHHRARLQLDDSFLSSIRDARYTTLVHVGVVMRIRRRPIEKSDLRGWVVLARDGKAIGRSRQMELPLDW